VCFDRKIIAEIENAPGHGGAVASTWGDYRGGVAEGGYSLNWPWLRYGESRRRQPRGMGAGLCRRIR
jgi:hypothetical protein